MASASKKRKVDKTLATAPAASECTILDLNDDCLLKICEYLDLAGLCSFADVCEKFKQNAQLHFGLKKLGDITKMDWRALTNRAQFSLLRNFGSSILSLTVWSRYEDDFLAEMIVRYCSAPLNSMSLYNVQLNQESVEKLQPLLSRLQKIDLTYCNFDSLLFEMLPSCAPELRELKLDRGLDVSRGKFKTIPKLVTFSIIYFDDEDFEGFIEKNQQLKTIEVSSGFDLHWLEFRNVFDSLAKCVPSIENFTVSCNFAIPSVATLRNLSALKRLVLDPLTTDWNTNLLNKLAVAQVPIEFLEIRDDDDQLSENLISSISELRRIKTLRLRRFSDMEQSVLEMCNNLVDLTELYLLSKRTYFPSNRKVKWSADMVLKIVRNAKKLQTLYAFMPVDFPQKSIIDVDMYTKILHVVKCREENKYLKIVLLDRLHSIDVPQDLIDANKHMLTIEIDKDAEENHEFFYDEFDW